MATATPPAPPATPPLRGVQPLRAGEGHSFFWRRLHSLTGIVPIGAFLIEHIVSNFEALNGPLAYAQQVKFLNSLPLVRVLEWGLIFIPLAYHALYGVLSPCAAARTSTSTPGRVTGCTSTQRVTGIIALLYIVQHLWRQRFTGVMLPEHPGAAFAKVQHELSNPWMLAIYVVAMIATTWHFAYGVWLFAAKWGITPGDKARKRFGYVCAVAGIALCLMGLASMYAFVGIDKYKNAPEDVMPEVSEPAPTASVPAPPNTVAVVSQKYVRL